MDKQMILKIGAQLRELRKNKGYSLEEVATRVGKSRKSIHAYEKGFVDISISTLKSLMDVYGVSLGEFLDNIE